MNTNQHNAVVEIMASAIRRITGCKDLAYELALIAADTIKQVEDNPDLTDHYDPEYWTAVGEQYADSRESSSNVPNLSHIRELLEL